jgi:hypothetical protein
VSHDDFEFEPVRGLPARLPEGEQLLWQGSPAWLSLAIRAYHIRKVAVYFALLIAWRIWMGVQGAHPVSAIVLSCLFLAGLGAAAIGVLSALAYFASRATVYSITSRRVLLRHGVAVPMTLNVPFKSIESAELGMFADRTGDVAIRVVPAQRVGYLITWPHLRPGRFAQPQPALRGLRDAARAAHILGSALAADAGTAAEAGTASVAAPDREPPAKTSGAGTLPPRAAAAA